MTSIGRWKCMPPARPSFNTDWAANLAVCCCFCCCWQPPHPPKKVNLPLSACYFARCYATAELHTYKLCIVCEKSLKLSLNECSSFSTCLFLLCILYMLLYFAHTKATLLISISKIVWNESLQSSYCLLTGDTPRLFYSVPLLSFAY